MTPLPPLRCSTWQLSYLVEVVKDDTKLPKLLDSPRHVNITIQIDGEGSLVDNCLHAGHSEVVVAVVEPGVDQALFAKAEDLPTGERTWAEGGEVCFHTKNSCTLKL